ncbi:MAG TPA: hypothetical protein VEY91_07030 [Candidatus Limnocylindria bacterium]|nr:hypothetical protein [Candidatus Limnocylindria bacterium]
MASETTLVPEDRALLERLAARVVELHLELPAIVTLETAKPLSFLAGQTLTFFEPMVQSLFRFDGYRRFADLVERREALELLARMIEDQAEQARQARRRAADERRAARTSRRS